jgi:transcriptional regulator with XRE-family HTH domain
MKAGISDTAGMPSLDEKLAFSLRLKQALKRSPKKIETATELALNFNLRHAAGPITTQAAQKWLTGQALPTIDKIATLADWLNVSLQWLRFGIAEDRPAALSTRKVGQIKVAPMASPSTEELMLLATLRAMPEHRRNLVMEIVEQFSVDQAMWRE